MALTQMDYTGNGSDGEKGKFVDTLSYDYKPNNFTYVECGFAPKHVWYQLQHASPIVVYADIENQTAYYWNGGTKASFTFSDGFDVQGTQLGFRGVNSAWKGADNIAIVG